MTELEKYGVRMTLAEALMERSALKNKISELRDRIDDNILVQESDKPAEDPQELLSELNRAITELERLISRINKTNCVTLLDGESLTALIARRDMLNLKFEAYSDFSRTARSLSKRARGTEIRIVSCMDAKKLQQEQDKTAKALRELDVKLQKANWLTELLEL